MTGLSFMDRSVAGSSVADPLVSVVIPARNEEASIRHCLESILAQDYTNFEILVVDGDSDDATAEIVSQMAAEDDRITLIHNPDRVIPKSLNLALDRAKGVYLVRVDAHAAIPPEYVGVAVSLLSTGRWGGVGGRKDGVGRTPAGRAIALAMASPFGVGGSKYHYGETAEVVDHIPFGCYVIEKARKLGGWDERLLVNQDFEFDYRMRQAGEELLFDPRLSIDWECRQTVGDLWRQYVRYGGGKAKVLAMHPSSASLRHLAVPGYVAALAGALLAAPWTRTPLKALLVPYASFLALGVARISRRTDDPAVRRWIGPSLAAMHIGWGVGFLKNLPMVAGMVLSSGNEGSDTDSSGGADLAPVPSEDRAM